MAARHLRAASRVEPLVATWVAILRRLARAGYTYEQSSAVLTFLERAVALPQEAEARVQAELDAAEGTNMPRLMSRWEAEAIRRGEEIGQQRGQQQERQSLVLMLLEQQCGPPSPETAGYADLDAWLAAHDPARADSGR